MYSESSVSFSCHNVKGVNIGGGCASNVYCDLVTYMQIRAALNLPNIASKALSFAVFLSLKEYALFCKKLVNVFPCNLHVYM
jgi:hypothetical protein